MRKVAIWIIRQYQRIVSPWVASAGVHCIYEVRCSDYAIERLKKDNVMVAVPKIVWRVLSCNPVNGWLRARKINKG